MTSQDLLKKIEEFFFKIGNLQTNFPTQIRKLDSKFNPEGAYKEYSFCLKAISNPYSKGLWGRIDLWKDKILPNYDNLKLEEISGQEGLKIECVNRFYKSRIRLEDPVNNRIFLDVWTPKFSIILSYLLGNKIKARLRKSR